jgi:hypothetical protein
MAKLKIGKFNVHEFDDMDAAFGAQIQHYPPMHSIPEVDRKYSKIVSSLFFKGGNLSDHGLQFKPDIDQQKATKAIRAFMHSFAPKHEHKTATVAWALSEWCEGV